MSECKCGAFQKFQGSGCRYCNPQDTIKQLQQQNAELVHKLNEWFTEKEFASVDEMQGAWLATEELKKLADKSKQEG